MKNVAKFIALFLSPYILVYVLYVVVLLTGGFRRGYSWSDMDWDGNGTTSFGEAMRADEVGVRVITVEGKACREFFNYKDGMPIKTSCYVRDSEFTE